MLPTRRRITDEDLQLILAHDLDDEFMDDISSDAGSASGSDDDDSASVDESQLNIAEEADDSLSDAEASDHDGSVPLGWMGHSPVSRDRLPFTGDSGVKVVLENPQNPLDIFLAFLDDTMIEHLVSENAVESI